MHLEVLCALVLSPSFGCELVTITCGIPASVKVDALEPFWYHLARLGYYLDLWLCEVASVAYVVALCF